MTELLAIHKALYMGLGGSFDLYCGKTKPVPEWWKKVFKWEGIYKMFSRHEEHPAMEKTNPGLENTLQDRFR